jgi:hypothetical protein
MISHLFANSKYYFFLVLSFQATRAYTYTIHLLHRLYVPTNCSVNSALSISSFDTLHMGVAKYMPYIHALVLLIRCGVTPDL